MTVAAMTGPTPKTSVRLVPDALTAAASFVRASRRRAPRWRMPASSSAASSQRAWATGSDGLIWLRSLATWPAMISSGTPPGISSHSSACSRQTAWLRARDRSRCRLAHTFSTRAWPSAVTTCLAADRSAATATDRASLGSFLLVFPVCSSRTRAASLGCTSSTRSPAATSCWASRPPSPRAPSTAQVRSGRARAQATSLLAWSGQARTRSVPSGSSAAPTATAVCEPLCGSIPIITAISTLPSSPGDRTDRSGHALYRTCAGRSPLFRDHATARSDGAGASI